MNGVGWLVLAGVGGLVAFLAWRLAILRKALAGATIDKERAERREKKQREATRVGGVSTIELVSELRKRGYLSRDMRGAAKGDGGRVLAERHPSRKTRNK